MQAEAEFNFQASQTPTVDQIMQKHLPKNEYDTFKQVETEYKTASDTYAEEVLALERKFRQSTQNMTKIRGEYLKKIPHFWATAMTKHSDLKPYLDDDQVQQFLKDHLVDLQVIFAMDNRFGEQNVKKYGKDGLVLMIEFKKNDVFNNQYITKAIGKRIEEGTEIAFCEGSKIEWKNDTVKNNFTGPIDDDECSDDSDDDIQDEEVKAFEKACGIGAGGENDDVENFFSFFKWWETSSDELQCKGLDENGCDKFSRAILDDLWSNPVEWYEYEAADDSDEDSSDDDDDDTEHEGEDGEEEML